MSGSSPRKNGSEEGGRAGSAAVAGSGPHVRLENGVLLESSTVGIRWPHLGSKRNMKLLPSHRKNKQAAAQKEPRRHATRSDPERVRALGILERPPAGIPQVQFSSMLRQEPQGILAEAG